MAKKKVRRSMPVQIALGSVLDFAFMAALTAAASWLVLGGLIGQGRIGEAALTANALAVFLGSLFAARGFAQKKLPLTLASAVGYLVLLLLGNLLFVGAPAGGWMLVVLPTMGAAALAALLASRKPKAKRRR